ncbi:AAA family ATPase [Rhizobium sp. TRM95111]|uniref:AAA family ATPase n=1 Tax=Rhizobium alarense TaxID=2846851 RepID=UPI001F1876F5|nr:AAA family ATPase [Rhizobium alarense]MCF3639455.1 AAA family ATPase [Rhizobium alarense]
MRLNRLDLSRYGKFTDRTLDFGRPSAEGMDFHLVYGPNEAGKSTLFSAYLDLVFGIERTSAYGFLHGYPQMKVGGSLSVGAASHDVHRLKRNQGSLVGPDDRPVPETLFLPVLGGMDRAAYQMMFSLDDESIERGGEAILKSEGELGALLFSAGSGLSDVATGLDRLRAEADVFYRPQARKHDLAALKADIEALADERRRLDVAARDFGNLVREREALEARYAESLSRRAATRAAMDEVERRIGAIPLLGRLAGLRAELAAFEAGDAPPPEWRDAVARLSREEAEIDARAERLDRDLAQKTEARDALVPDAAILAIEDEISAVAASPLEARFRTAQMDLAAREADRTRGEAEVAAALRALDAPAGADPATLVLPAAIIEALSAAAARWSGLREKTAAAEREAAEAARLLGKADDGAKRFGEPAAMPVADDLSAALRAARAGGLVSRLRDAERLVAQAQATLRPLAENLAPWTGDPAQLSGRPVPAADTLSAWRRRREALAERERRFAETRAALAAERAAQAARLDGIRAESDVMPDAEARHLREARDAAWRRHRQALGEETAATFEAALAADDAAAARRLAEAGRLSDMRAAARALAEAEARLSVLPDEAAAIAAERVAVDGEIMRAAAALGLPEAPDIDGLEDWLRRRQAAAEAAAVLDRCRAELAVLRAEADTVSRRLATLLGGEPVSATAAALEELFLVAEDRLAALKDMAARARAAAEALRDAREAVEQREAAHRQASAELARWTEDWTALLAGTWLGDCRAPEAVARLVVPLQDLARRLESTRELDHRIEAMRRDRAAYAEQVRHLVDRLGLDDDGTDPLRAFQTIVGRLQQARDERRRQAALAADVATLEEERARLDERQRTHRADAARILAALGVATLDEAAARLGEFARRETLRQRVDETALDLTRQLATATVEEAEARLAATDEAGLQLERARLATAFEAEDAELRDLHATRMTLFDTIARIGGDGTVAAIEERRRTLVVETAERAWRHLSLRAGILAAETALRLYRDRHRSDMMRRASDAFRVISGGEYSGLSTVMEKDQELLIAVAAAGGSKLARELSKGTRFQLYLALRVAGYHEIAATRETLPFIADDIMETFDDGRSLNALRLMAEMSRAGQVIYLTHHQHLCDIARAACPSVTIHEL